MRLLHGTRVLVAISLILGFLYAVVAETVTPLQAVAVQATGGSGRFRAIEWFSWGAEGANISNGGISRTETYTVAGQPLAITCSLSNIQRPRGSGTGTYLTPYRSGSWGGDGFDDLYNIGGPNAANTMVVGLAPRADSSTVTFDFSCSATLGGSPFALAGLVMADAEASGSSEYVGATINGGTWRILDRVRGSTCTLDAYARRTGTTAANRLELYGPVSNTCENSTAALPAPGPSAVAFMDGVTSASDVTIYGGGRGAIALGVALNFDFGDAPLSYGQAGAALQYTYTGGELPITTGTLAQNRGTPVFGSVTLAQNAQPALRLGASVDPELSQAYSSDATGDDTTGESASGGPDDEDAVTLPASTLVVPGGTTSVSVACNGTGSLAGWIDWNSNGQFDASTERSTTTPSCPSGGGNVTLTFAVPSTILPDGGALTTFLRLRIATTTAQLTPVSVSTGGEVEDHRIVFTTAPRLTLAKSVAGRVSPSDQFTVTAAGAGLPGSAVSATTTGTATTASTTTNYVQTGQTYTLTDAMAAGSQNPLSDYTPTIRCVDRANGDANVTTSGTGPVWSVSSLAAGQYVVCTITNTPRPAAIDVAKTAGTASGPSADGQYTVSYQVTVSNTGPLPGTYGPLTDRPGFASNLVVDGITWTTSGTGAPASGSATGSGPFTIAGSGTTIARDTTHTFNVVVSFHYSNRTNASACDGTSGNGLFNRATLPDGQEAGSTSNNSACVAPPAAPTPRLAFDKSAGPIVDLDGNGVDAGDRITYTFTVTNSGNVTVRNLAIQDSLVTATCLATTLAPGAGTTCTGNYLLTQSDVDSGAVNNTARASGADPNGTAVTSATDSTSTSWVPAATLAVDKQAAAPVDSNGNGRIDAGDRITYSFIVTNSGNSTVSGVGVSDGRVAPVTCAPTTLVPGASATCTAPAYVITQADMNAGSVANTARATGTAPGGGGILSAPDSTSTSLVAIPALEVDKRAGSPVDVNTSGITDAGDTIAYTFVVTNTGNVTIAQLGIDDSLLSGISCPVTSLAPGTSTTCTAATYTITVADQADGAVVNRAAAAGTTPTGGAVRSPEDTTRTPVTTPNPRLSFDKSAGTPVDVNGSGITDAGDTIAYTFTVGNTGNVPLHGLALTDLKLGAVTCAATALGVGASTTCGPVTYTVTEADEALGVVANSASASALDPNNGSVTSPVDSTSTPVTTPAPALRLTKTAGTPVDVNASGITDAGDTIAYTFTITNTGNVGVRDIAINDPMLGAVTCAATTLAPLASTTCGPVSHTVTEADEAAGSVRNSATAGGRDPDAGTVTSPPATTTTPVTTPAPALRLAKSAGRPVDVNASGITDAGDTIAYAFTVTNTGNVPVSGVAVSDPRLAAQGITLACPTGPLAPGASVACTASGPYTVTTADETAGVVTNSAAASGTDPDGGPVTSPVATTSTIITAPAPSLALAKTAGTPVDVNGSGITDAGDTVAYTFTVRNTGNVPISSLVIDDPMLASIGVTCTATTLAPGVTTTCAADAPYTVSVADVAAGEIVNIAGAAGTAPGGRDVTSPPATTTTVTTAPDPRVILDKSAAAPVDVNSSGITDAGDTIAFSFRITNTGNVPLHGITISDPLLNGLGITCAATVLAPGASTSCAPSGPYVVSPADELTGVVANTAVARAIDSDDEAVTSAPDSTSTPVVTPRPALVLVKAAGTPVDVNSSGITDAGDTIAYTFSVTNTGNVPIGAVAVIDPKLAAQGVTITCSATTLAPAASTTCAASPAYVVTAADELAGAAANTATVSGRDPDGDPVTSPPANSSTPVTAPRPLLVLDKTAAAPVDVNGSGITDAGDTIAYSFTVTNTGNVPVRTVAVSDPRLAGQGITVTCAATTLAPGGVTACTAAPYVVTEADELAGSVVNTATPAGIDPDGDPVPTVPDSTSTPVTRPQPLLVVEKSAGAPVDVDASGLTDAGDTIAFSFTVTNPGNVPITDVGIVDDRISAAITCAATTLAPGGVTTCGPVTYTVTTADELAGTVVNTATARGADPDGDPVTSPDDGTSTPTTVPARSLTVEKTAGIPVDTNSSGITDAGDTVVYRFLVTNTGNVPLRSVAIDDDRLGGLAITCAAGSLAPGQQTTCQSAPYTVTAADVAAGAVVNTASATATGPNGEPVASPEDSATVPVTRPAPALTVVKTPQTPVDHNSSGITDAGDGITYSFLVTNTGNVPLRDVTIGDAMLGAVTCPAGTVGPGNTVTCTSAEYRVTAVDVAAGAVVNTATASATNPDGGLVTSQPDTATVPTTTPLPGLVIEKTAAAPVDVNSSGLTDAGDTIEYAFAVTNTGNVPISDPVVLDPLLTGAGLTITCPAGPLSPGATVTCAPDGPYTVTSADVAASAVVNSARVRGTDPDGGTVTSAPDGTTTPTTTPEPGLLIDKAAGIPVDVNGSGLTDAGDTIAYTFTVTNEGNVPITGVGVVDPLLAGQGIGITCTPSALAPGATGACAASRPYVVTAADVATGAVANSATAHGTDPDGGAVASPADATTTPTTLPQPGLVIDKRAGSPVDANSSGITDAGDLITFSYTIANVGNVPVAGVGVNDPKLAGITITCTPTVLAPGQNATCATSGPYRVTAADVAAGAVANVATATGTNPDGGPVTSEPDTTSTPTTLPQPSLSVRKSASPVDDLDGNGPDAGDRITFTFDVTNNGNVPLRVILVHDAMLSPDPIECDPPLALAPGQTAACVSRAYTVTQADFDAGKVFNTARATGIDPDDGVITSPDSDTTTALTTTPALQIVKSVESVTDRNSSGITDVGDGIRYSFVVTNPGNVTISGIAVDDPLLRDNGISVRCGDDPGVPQTSLEPGASMSCVALADVVVKAGDIDAGHVVNTATAVGTGPGGDEIRSRVSTVSTPTTRPEPQLSIEKTAAAPVDVNGSGITDAGDTIAYTFVIVNTGNVPVGNLAVVDPRLADAGVGITCDDLSLAPGARTSCEAVRPYVVSAADVAAGAAANSATAVGTDPDGGGVSSAPDTTTTPTTRPSPGLQLVKRVTAVIDANGSGLTDAGDRISYAFSVTNTGNVPLAAVRVSDPKLTSAGITVTCPADPLPVGATVDCAASATYQVTAADVADGAVANSAVAGATDPDGGAVSSPPATTSTGTTTPRPALVLAKSVVTVTDVNASGLTDAGDTIEYAFAVTNTGNVPITDLAVDDPRLAGVTIDCTGGPLLPGDTRACTVSGTYVVTTADEALGSVANSATAHGVDPDGGTVTSPEATTATPTAVPEPGLVLDKAIVAVTDVNGSTLTDAGDVITYEFTLTNSGNVPLTDPSITDPMLTGITCPTAPLAVGESVTCTADPYVVTAADVASGVVSNTAVGGATDPDGDPVTSPPDGTVVTTTAPAPALLLAKSVTAVSDLNSSGITDAGDTIEYSFVVTNTGNVPLIAVTVTDPTIGEVTCPTGALAPGASLACSTATHVVTEADEVSGLVQNTATAGATDPDGGAVTSPPDSTSTGVTTPAPGLRLVKSVTGVADVNGSGITDAPDEITYEFTVTNTGNVPVSAVTVSDPLLAAQGVTITCAPSDLATGADATCTVSGPYVISAADEDAGSVRNVATASATDPDDDVVTSPADSTTTPVTRPVASLGLVKSVVSVTDVNGSGITDAPDQITYAFEVTNTGNVPVSAVTVSDPLLAARGLTITCLATTLPPGDSTTCAPSGPYVVSAADEAGGVVVNTASVAAIDPDGDPVAGPSAQASVPTTQPFAGLQLTKSVALLTDVNGSGLTDAGDTIEYAFAVTNTGNVPLSGLVIDDPLLAGLTVSCTDTTLAVGASTDCAAAPYVVTEADEAAGSVANTAAATASDPDGDPVTSPPSSVTTPTTVPDPRLLLDKTATLADANGSGITDAGDTITFGFVVTNTGNVPISGIAVTDSMVTGLVCTPDVLLPGGSATCTADPYEVTVDDMEVGAVTNTATAGGTDPDGATVTSPSDATATALEQLPGLALVKTAELDDRNGNRRADAGETIEYFFEVTNTGNVPVRDIVIADTLLADAGDLIDCPSLDLFPGESMTCTAEHRVTRAEAARDRIVNVATAIGDWAGGVVASAAATAVVRGAGNSGSGLAYTGAEPAGLASVALIAILGGLLLVFAARRRRRGVQ